MFFGPAFWIDVNGTFVHSKCLDAKHVRFCQMRSAPVGKCRCGASLRDVLEGRTRLNEQAVGFTASGWKDPFIASRGCANETVFSPDGDAPTRKGGPKLCVKQTDSAQAG